MMARKKKIHHRHNRLSFGGKLAFVLLTILSAVILIPIVFTFLYSFFPQSEITAYLNAFEVGEPFVTAGLIHAVMETGVAQNCTVPASVADFTPNAGEIVTAGAVNVLETQ